MMGELLLTVTLILFSWSAWKAESIEKKINCNCFGNFSKGNLGKQTFFRIIPIGILNCILLLYPKETSIIRTDLIEVTSILMSSIGILVIWLLISTYYSVASALNRAAVLCQDPNLK
jgi:hypothetical protein